MLHIKNGNLYTITNGILEGQDILIEDGKIKEIGKDLQADGAEVIDASGKYVTPGFIEAHSHVGLYEDGVGKEAIDHNESVDPITPHLRAIDGVNAMDKTLVEGYEAGITTAAPSPGSANVIGGIASAIKLYGNRIDDMIIKDSVGMKVALGENPKRFYGDRKKAPATRMGIAGLLRETLSKTEEYLRKKEEAAGDASKLPAFDMKLEAMIPVIKKEIPLKAHAHRADDIFTIIRIAKEFDLDLTIDHCTDGHLIADQLAAEGHAAIVGPTFGRRSKQEVKNKDFSTAKILYEAGVKIALTTDSPVIPLYGLPLTAGLAIKAGLPEEEAFKAITINPAEILGLEDRIGSLEVGKDADIAIFDGHPLRDITHRVDYTLINGKVIYINENK